MIIAVDFDGVIHEKTEYGDGSLGAPVAGAIEALNALHEQGHDVFIYTSRLSTGWPDYREVRKLTDWLRRHGLTFSLMVTAKPIADVYVDDKALRFSSWAQTAAMLDDKTRGA